MRCVRFWRFSSISVEKMPTISGFTYRAQEGRFGPMSGPAATPKLRDDLIVSEQESGGQTVFVLKDPITRRYFRLREPEYYLVRQFDGSRDFEAVARRFREKFNLNVTPEQVGAFASKLQSLAFFEGTRAEYETSAARHRVEKRKSLLSRVLFIKLKAFNPEKLLDVLIKIARPFFHPIAVAGMIVLVIAGFGVWSANMSHFSLRLAEIFSVPSLLVIFLSFATIIFIHEFAHALTCRYFGGQVSEIGFLLLFFQICFYANLSDSWLFPRKSQRMAVIWAGVFFQMVLFALAVFGWRLTVIGTPVNQFLWLTANVCLIMLLFNINPLIKLDGYYFLSELIDVPNLRAKSFAWLKNRIKRQIGLDVKPFESSRRERRIFFWYVLFASLFSALLIGYIAFLVQRLLVEWLGGFGFLLFLLFVAVIIRRPVTQAAEFVFSREVIRALVSKTRNLVTAGVLIVVIVVFFFLIPFPRRVGGPVAVKPIAEFSVTMLPGQGQLQLNIKKRGKAQEYQTEYIQLASTDMSVLKLTPLVKEGDLVVNGDTLAAILSNQISASLDAARAELERLKGELALAKSPPKPEEIATAEAEVTAAEAKRDKLENEVERSKQLFKKSLISKQELEDVEAQLRVAVSNF
jgi:putative peptide zinc metalloprotease protein